VVASLLDLEVTSMQKSGTLVSDYSGVDSPPQQSAPGATSLPATSAHSTDPSACSTSAKCQLVRNRKGSLSAVIDKLKSAQTSPDLPERKDSDKPSKSSSSSQKSSDSKNGVKNSEYMVKSSSDGIKITINKTKKDGSSKSSSSSSSSYKSSSSLPSSPKHTGLKPGVISGPASKKTQQKSNSSSSSSRNSSPSSSKQSSSSKSGTLSPSTSKSSSSSKSNSSPKSSSSDKSRSKNDKSSSKDRRPSPSTFKDDQDGEKAFKILAAQAKLDIEMPKLDTKFHIPKLSRSENKESGEKKTERHLEPKVEIKKLDDREKPRSFSPAPSNNIKLNPVVSLPMLPRTDSPFKISEKDFDKKVDSPLPAPKPKDYDNSMPPDLSSQLSPPKLTENPFQKSHFAKPNLETPNNKCDSDSNDSSPGLLIDFSLDKKSMKGSPPPPNLTPANLPKSPLPVHLPPVLSPSVSVHIVKSPAPVPSPLILPSPHSSQPSPCITDDELMDEALVGLGK
jgi:mediator of RNA polymerase II transcription subunit 1